MRRWLICSYEAHLKGRCHQDQPGTGHVQAMKKAAVVPSIGQDGPRPQHVLSRAGPTQDAPTKQRWLEVKTLAP